MRVAAGQFRISAHLPAGLQMLCGSMNSHSRLYWGLAAAGQVPQEDKPARFLVIFRFSREILSAEEIWDNFSMVHLWKAFCILSSLLSLLPARESPSQADTHGLTVPSVSFFIRSCYRFHMKPAPTIPCAGGLGTVTNFPSGKLQRSLNFPRKPGDSWQFVRALVVLHEKFRILFKYMLSSSKFCFTRAHANMNIQVRWVLVDVSGFPVVSQYLMKLEYWIKTTSEKYLHEPLWHCSGGMSTSADHDCAASEAPSALW